MNRQCLRDTSLTGIRRSQSSRRPMTVTSRVIEKLRFSPSARNITRTTCMTASLSGALPDSGSRLDPSEDSHVTYQDSLQDRRFPILAPGKRSHQLGQVYHSYYYTLA